MEKPVFKKCTCGVEYSKEEWEQLEHCGSQIYDDENGAFIHLKMRHCAKCGSTIGVDTVVDCIQ